MLFSSDLDPLAYLEAQGVAFIVVTAVLVIAIAVASDDDGIAQRILSVQPLRLLGAVSFPVYLWHLPLFWAASRWAAKVDWAPRAAVTLLVLAAIVLVTDRFIERPISRWLRRPQPGVLPNNDVLPPLPSTAPTGSASETDETRPRRCQPLQSPA
jgi:peptidoglycan/LPS O-acetylase OafA/YrhL